MLDTKAAAILTLVVAVSVSAAGGELVPGGNKGIKCKDAPQYTYDVYLPRAYGAEAERRFPVLFLSSPGANPGFMETETWAEKNGVIVVAINDTKNNQDLATWDEIQKAVMDSAEAGLRVHPCLRFSMGFSGGGMASMRLANRYKEKFAGIVMLAHSGNGEDDGLPKYISVAFVHAQNDTTHSIGSVESVFKQLKSRGHSVRKVVGDWGHDPGPVEHRLAMLDWVLDLARLSHPRLSEAERAEARAEIKRRVEALAGTADPAQRLKNAETLLGLPDYEKWPEVAALLAAWFSARYDLASSAADPIDKHEALTALSEEERVRKCSIADQKRLVSELSAMRSKQPIKNEWAAKQAYDQTVGFEQKAGKDKTKLMQVVQSYAAIARAYPNTRVGKKAAEDTKRLAGSLGIPLQ